jgi:hypothetical protein
MRQNPAKGFIDGYYRLVESYRNADNRVCHRTMLNVGFLDMEEVSVDQLNQIQKYLTIRSEHSSVSLFEEKIEDPTVRHYVDTLYARLLSEKKIDVCPPSQRQKQGDWLNSLRNRDAREIGGEWLCYQAIEQLKIIDFLTGLEDNSSEVTVTDRENRKISLQKVNSGKNDDYYLKISSETKKKKECAMNNTETF